MANFKIVANEEELLFFHENILPPLLPTEVYFLSLSSRNKYLTEEEKKVYELGRNEMFAKTIVRDSTWERFIRAIRRLECDERGYTTKNDMPIPQKSLVCYININPSNTIKALNEFNKITNEYMFELANTAIGGKDQENILNRINKIDNNLMTCYQTATGTKYWIDFDLDVSKAWKPYNDPTITQWLEAKGITKGHYYWIATKSGYHLLLDKQKIKFNPFQLVELLTNRYANDFIEYTLKYCPEQYPGACKFEIIKNDNAMIPMPGTFQGEYPVRIINKN